MNFAVLRLAKVIDVTHLVDTWYRGVDGAAKERIKTELMLSSSPSIRSQTRDTKEELFTLLKAHVGPVLLHGFDWQKVEDHSLRSGLERLQHVLGHAATWMPETSFVTVLTAAGPSTHLTILRDSAHSNVTHLFNEDDRRLKEEDALSVVRGFLGAYPNALFNVQRKDFDAFVDASYWCRFGVITAGFALPSRGMATRHTFAVSPNRCFQR